MVSKKNKSADPKQNATPPVFVTGMNFPSWERELFYSVKEALACDLCGSNSYGNQGVSGEPCQGGFRRISLKCSDEDCDAGSVRLHKVLERCCPDLYVAYNQAYELANVLKGDPSVISRRNKKTGVRSRTTEDLECVKAAEIESDLSEDEVIVVPTKKRRTRTRDQPTLDTAVPITKNWCLRKQFLILHQTLLYSRL